MRSCQEVFTVATIFRPISDPVVKDVISRCGTHRPLRIVCTRSEVVRLVLPKLMSGDLLTWSQDVNPSETERIAQGETRQAIIALRKAVGKLKDVLRKLGNARRKGHPIKDRNQDLEDETRTKFVKVIIEVETRKANSIQGTNCKKRSLSILPNSASIVFES